MGTWQSVSLGGTVSSTLCGFLEVHSPISHGPICDPEGKKNISTQSKQLISVLSCLGSFNVIIIPPKALVSVRLISTTAADTIIKAPGFLCSKSYTDKAQKVCFGGKIKHGIFFFLTSSPSCFLPYRDQGEAPECPTCSWKQTHTYGAVTVALTMLTGPPEKPCDEAGVMPRGGCWLLPRDLTR